MDEEEYVNKVRDMIAEGPYEEIKYLNGKTKNPLPSMVADASQCIQQVAEIMNSPKLRTMLKVKTQKCLHYIACQKSTRTPSKCGQFPPILMLPRKSWRVG